MPENPQPKVSKTRQRLGDIAIGSVGIAVLFMVVSMVLVAVVFLAAGFSLGEVSPMR